MNRLASSLLTCHRIMISRRRLLEIFGAAGAAFAAGCGSSTTSSTSASTSSSSTSSGGSGGTSNGSSACVVTPEETAGPYPDRIGMIGNAGYFRRDVTEGRSGLPFALTLTIVNVKSSCGAIAGANVEIWQCDATGNYSEYLQPGFDGTGQTFLRGVQTTDANGRVTFNT